MSRCISNIQQEHWCWQKPLHKCIADLWSHISQRVCFTVCLVHGLHQGASCAKTWHVSLLRPSEKHVCHVAMQRCKCWGRDILQAEYWLPFTVLGVLYIRHADDGEQSSWVCQQTWSEDPTQEGTSNHVLVSIQHCLTHLARTLKLLIGY